ncbi:MAG TPA: SDR family oxidoreductase [Candidatus Limnocylindrales bacterium]|nr:SDR family oxidoreductase [Candidatus Limnocylindrales bacterium]
MSDSSLTGRVAVVTGAGTGLGMAISRALADAGADLLLHYRSSAASLDGLAADCRGMGRRVETMQADFAEDPALAAGVVDAAVERLGRIDILVNNAAVTTKLASFETLSQELFEETLAVNVTAPFLASQAAGRHMVAAGRGGRIINIGSVHALVSAPGAAAYEASKGGIVALTRASAVSLGQHGITVNCVGPGVIVVERYDELDWDEDWYRSRIPVGRTGHPEDIAATVRFLASDEAGFISGETIYVDGGMTRRMSLVK